MTYQRTTRRQRQLRYAKANKERIHTGLGHLFRVLRWCGATRIARALVRKPWHVADLYVDGHFVRALYIYPKENVGQRMKRVEDMARRAVERKRPSPTTTTRNASPRP